MRRFEVILALFALCYCGLGQATAAPITFYKEGTEVGTFTFNSNSTRTTLFQALNNVRLTQLGALIDPASSSMQFRWRIYNSNDSFAYGSLISDQTLSFTDVGMATYDTAVNTRLLTGNYYILSLQSVNQPSVMTRFDEADQGLPFVTSDGNFRVINGGDNFGSGNIILPAFSVAASVPEPSTFLLLLASLAGLGLKLYSVRGPLRDT